MSQPNPTETYLLEAQELLAQIEQSALDALSRPRDDEAINRLFRAFHTIKGSGSMFGFDAVAEFTHHVETVLDEVRSGLLPMTPPLVDLLLRSKDQIEALLAGSSPAAGDEIVAALKALKGADAAPQPAAPPQAAPLADGARAAYRISFRPPPGLAATGLDPASLLDELRALGECEVVVNTDAVPTLDALQPDQCYLSWEILLTTEADANAIRDIFIFVEDDSEIRIEREPCILALTTPPKSEPALIANEHADAPARPSERKTAAAPSTARVPSEKLDRLVNLVGELVMNQSRLIEVAASIDSAELAGPVEAIERLVSELRDSVLSIRMMPIGATFSQLRRLVHDLSNELGKEIELATEGEDTELDKTVIDQLGDPLVHLIRNSIDHGIELPGERAAAHKPKTGKIRLSAAHKGAHVVVTIQDDGRGLHADTLRAKAVEKGLIARDANLSEAEAFNLIFHPGFSTAKKVTSVSGRGVGMDVVRRQIEALRGSIRIASKAGQGTTISLSLPLTLAIIEGLVVEIAGDRFIIPMSAVTENVELAARERAACNGRNLVHVRGELVPYLGLRALFGIADAGPDLAKVVIAQHEGQRVGLVVDRVLGSHQTVIQSLGQFYEDIEVVSGATIMGDGRVALILDVAGLVRFDAKQAQGARDRRCQTT